MTKELMVKYQKSCMRYSLRNTTENEFVAMLISLGFNKPKRQHVFLSKIFDFYFKGKQIRLELDGPEHNKEIDQENDEHLFRHGIVTFRFPNNDYSSLSEFILFYCYEGRKSTHRQGIRKRTGITHEEYKSSILSKAYSCDIHNIPGKPLDIYYARILEKYASEGY